MSWFRNHLNLTFFFAWLVGNALIYWGRIIAPSDGSLAAGWLTLFVIAAIVILGTEVWYLKQKHRSLFFLFLNLLIYLGFIIILGLDNKAIKPTLLEEKVETSVQSDVMNN